MADLGATVGQPTPRRRLSGRIPGRVRRLLTTYAIPVGLLVVAAVAFTEGLRMVLSSSVERPSAPPGIYLCTVAVLLAGTTVAGLVRSHKRREQASDPNLQVVEPDAERATADRAAPSDNAGPTRVWKALALMTLYAWSLPWLGFTVTTGLFVIVFLRWVAGYGLVKAVLYGSLIAAAAVMFFDLAGVLLPSGVLGL